MITENKKHTFCYTDNNEDIFPVQTVGAKLLFDNRQKTFAMISNKMLRYTPVTLVRKIKKTEPQQTRWDHIERLAKVHTLSMHKQTLPLAVVMRAH